MPRLQDFEFLVLALFSASFGATRAALQDVLTEFFESGAFELSDGRFEPGRVYADRPPAGGAHAKRVALFEPANAPGRTAMMANLEDGWVTLVNVLAERLPGEHLLLRSSEDANYPVADLEVWVDGDSVRYVGALKEDPSWEFNQRGEPRPYEDQTQYSKRRIRDRFNRAVAVATLERAGWSIASEGFWQSNQAFYAFERAGGA